MNKDCSQREVFNIFLIKADLTHLISQKKAENTITTMNKDLAIRINYNLRNSSPSFT